jgi:predicted alpha/beta hydrolase family esterase
MVLVLLLYLTQKLDSAIIQAHSLGNAMTIHIDNLTQAQVDMLDHMWSLETEQDYFDWYELLDAEDQHSADVLQRLIILESMEENLGNQAEARAVLQQFRL